VLDKTFQLAIGISVVLLFFVTLNIFFKDSVPSGVREMWSRVTGAAAQGNVTSATTGAPAVKEPKPKPKLRPRAQPAAVPEPLPETKPPTEVVKVELPPPFPIAEDLKAGMTRREMIGRFGAPRFTASWSESGALAEKFIYTRDAQVTAVILRDGHVVISRTGQSDPWARSAWWQAGANEKAEADRDGAKVP
jgi:hypothetical protein